MTTNAGENAERIFGVPASAGLALAPGIVLADKYRLSRPTGAGGMGTVWAALNLATGAEVAVKLLLPELAGYAEAVERFRHEAHATAQLSHRGIVRIFDLIEFGDEGNRSIAIVMELLRGRTLAAILDEREKLTVRESLEIILPLLSALSYAHAAGIVHRDLKPENVFLAQDPDGLVTPKIVDFGISKLCFGRGTVVTGENRAVGTPGYMAPEQAKGLPTVDPRSDLFNVGILLYEMLTGKNPFLGAEGTQDVMMLLERDPRAIEGIPTHLWKVIARALAKEPDARHADAAQLAAALRGACKLRPSWPTPPFAFERVLSPGPSSAVGAEFVVPLLTLKRPRRRAYAGGALIGAALVAALFTTAFTGSRAEQRVKAVAASTRPALVDPAPVVAVHATEPPRAAAASEAVVLAAHPAKASPARATVKTTARKALAPPGGEVIGPITIMRDPGF